MIRAGKENSAVLIPGLKPGCSMKSLARLSGIFLVTARCSQGSGECFPASQSYILWLAHTWDLDICK